MSKRLMFALLFLVLFSVIIILVINRENDQKVILENQRIILKYNSLNNINCPQVDRFFNVLNISKTFEKNYLMPIDTKLVFHNPGFLAINTYDKRTAGGKEEKSIALLGLKEFNIRSGLYLPIIYYVDGDQNISTVSTGPVTLDKLEFGFMVDNVVAGVSKNWYFLTQNICNYGEICHQALYKIDYGGINSETISIPQKYSPKSNNYFDSIVGIYNNSLIFKSIATNGLVEYDTTKKVWQDFSSNTTYSKINSAEKVMKQYGCFYIPAYQGDMVFYKHRLFSGGYPDFKFIDIFFNKENE